ncbi:MAG: DNA polymerase III subunit gamma/tau [Deltaproteobacteria bacterium]|nr:DNA polymerase III subunit gamma/tau [Deltaproteobacteria bacterium]MBW2067922.1 DNA polymerase III subunit gamma/tau [Deltaproteobacteria bacterium]
MSYLVLARKWRPQTFGDVVGQEHVTRVLQNAIRTGRLSHAYLFSGPRGVGKTSVARILAKAINCEKGITPEPCNECSNCQAITSGRFPDVVEIDGASNRGIENVRNLQESITYRPIKGRSRIFIIDEVHMLTTEAFNALLKTLEEPPPHVHFVFATTEIHKVLPTVLSRCQRFEFRRIATNVIADHLRRICKAENFNVPDNVIEALASEADGSLRDAETLLEQVVAFQGEDIADEELLNLLGIVDQTTLLEAVEAILSSDHPRCVEIAQKVYERGIDGSRFCARLLEIFHELLLLKLSRNKLPPDQKRTIASRLGSLIEEIDVDQLQIYYELLLRATEQARRSSEPRFVVEATLLKIASVPRLIAIPQIVRALKDGKSVTVTQSIDAISERGTPHLTIQKPKGREEIPHSEPKLPPIDPLDPAKSWKHFVGWIDTQDPILGTALNESTIEVLNEKRWKLTVLSVYTSLLQQEEKQKKLLDFIRQFFGIQDLSLDIDENGKKKKSNGPASEAQDATYNNVKAELKQTVMNDPVVKDVLEILGARVVDIRPVKKVLKNSVIADGSESPAETEEK